MSERSGSFPEVGFIRLKQILVVFPVCKSAWWQGVKDGKYPAAVKLSERTTAWRVSEIRALLEHGLNWRKEIQNAN